MPGAKHPKTELSRFQRAMHKGFPIGTRTRSRLLLLHAEIWEAGRQAGIKWHLRKQDVSDPQQVKAMDREFGAWAGRMREYKRILRNVSSSDEQIDRNVVRGLLFSPGKGTHIADALFPISWGRRVKILLQHERERLLAFFSDMATEAQQILEDAKDTGKFIGENIKPIIVGATATILGGLILHVMVYRRR